jgi:two-component system sensor histidine kinase MprB
LSFRTRLSLLVATAVAVSVAAASAALYLLVSQAMLAQVDQTLRDRVTALSPAIAAIENRCFPGASQRSSTSPSGAPCTKPPGSTLPQPTLGGPAGYVQFFDATGKVTLVPGERSELPITAADRGLASRGGRDLLENATVNGIPVRIVTHATRNHGGIQIAERLDGIEAVLANLRWLLYGVCGAGIALGAVLGRGVARTALRPVDRLMLATEHVADTRDLRRRIDEPGKDELGRLAHSFNRMLEALDASERMQRRLVADASHELRTPLSSLRTNIELLARPNELPPGARDQLLAALLDQVERLTRLVADLIDLARGDEPTRQVRADIRLDEIVAGTAAVARTHFPDVRFVVHSQPTVVAGDANRLSRAVANLLDNAGKWSRPGDEVEVEVGAGTVTVRDNGPGIAPEHVPHVFDRFWRAPEARQKPGSGLGLAIVYQVARSHGGEISVEAAAGGGSRFRLRLPEIS